MGNALARMQTIATIAEVARAANKAGNGTAVWSRRRMARYLHTVNAQLNGTLLVNIGSGEKQPRWALSLSALERLNPTWFQNYEQLGADVDELKERADEHERVHEDLAAQLGELARENTLLRRRLEAIEARAPRRAA